LYHGKFVCLSRACVWAHPTTVHVIFICTCKRATVMLCGCVGWTVV
jgi:hypothetical protein